MHVWDGPLAAELARTISGQLDHSCYLDLMVSRSVMSSTPNSSFSTSPKGRIRVNGLLEFTLVPEEEENVNTSWANWSVDTIPVRSVPNVNNNEDTGEQAGAAPVEEERFEELAGDEEEAEISMRDLILSKKDKIEVITISDDEDVVAEALEPEREKPKGGDRFVVKPASEVEVKLDTIPELDPTATSCVRDPENPGCTCKKQISVRQDTVEIEDTVTPMCGDKLKLMLRAFKRDRSTPREAPNGAAPMPMATLRERDQWQNRLRYLLARQAEAVAYKNVYDWIINNEVNTDQLMALFEGAEDWPTGEFELADVYSEAQLKKNDRLAQALRVEAAEEYKMKQLIRAEIGANLSTAAAWQTQRGTMNGHRMERNFEDRLFASAEDT